MDKILIKGGKRLLGEVEISGSKNASLPILASFILANEECELRGVPDLADIKTMIKLLSYLGAECSTTYKSKININGSGVSRFEAPYDLVKTMRASVLVLGPLVAKYGKARVSLPGGCAIGARPINLHLKGLEALGAKISLSHGYVEAEAKQLKGNRVYFDNPTVGGTENILMAASLAKGMTVIENAAKEPEIIDLATSLTGMGAIIDGAGTDVITLQGVDELRPVNYELMPDRIEGGTFMVAAALTRGNVLIKNCPLQNLEAVVSKLKDAGIQISEEKNGVRVKGSDVIKSVDIKTMPYPGFPTDMQAQMMVLMSLANGLSVITENVFENRFMHVSELKRMGADIKIEGRTALVRGVSYLSGAQVMATDLRASASLILAGLAAEGVTEVSRIYHLDRGYEKIEEKFKKLGADISRVRAK